MFKWYGGLGIVLIISCELNMIYHIEPFASWYIPIIFTGFILLIDSLVFKLKKKSLISNNLKEFVKICLWSIPLWSIFEFINVVTQNWIYNEFYTPLIHLVDYLIIMPAVFETKELIMALGWFKKKKTKKVNLNNSFLSRLILIGILLIVDVFLMPKLFFWAMWIGFFFVFDPINYLIGNESLLSDTSKGKGERYWSLGLAGLICGFFWEFWNYWALPKWFYNVPFLDFWHVFEMPLLGYLGYISFAWSLFAMYSFVKGLFKDLKV